MTALSADKMEAANDAIAEGMAFVLTLWFVPIPVLGSAACNAAEAKMVRGILKAVHGDVRDADADALYWFFRKRYFLVNVATFVPYAGPAVQLLEAFGLGRFVIVCCERGIALNDEAAMALAFQDIEASLWDAGGAISFYERTTGSTFPEAVRGPFTSAVAALRDVLTRANAIPGMQRGQELAGEALRATIAVVKKPFK